MPSLSGAKARIRSITARSSLSDHGSYRAFCLSAAADDMAFSRFRSGGGTYSDILEHVPEHIAAEYWARIRDGALPSADERELLLNDSVGSPFAIDINGLGITTGSALRYVATARQILGALDPPRDCHFLEVGVGYGGQMRVLAKLLPSARFTLVDLPETLVLARRFLQEAQIDAEVEYVSASQVRMIKSDIFISNYALSELRRPVQENYIRKLVAPSAKGFVTWNSISPRSFRSISAEEFSGRVGGVMSEETPITYAGNKVITWGI